MSQKYYVAGNTAEGWVNHLPANLTDIQTIIVLEHESNRLKTSVLKQWIQMEENKEEVEVILSPLGQSYLDGFILRQQSLAVIVDRIAPSALKNTKTIDLNQVVASLPMDQQMIDAKSTFEKHKQQAYKNFAQGLRIHDDLESIYINEMDFNKADEIAAELINDVFSDIPNRNREAKVYKRFFGTNTPEGAVNVVSEILADIQHAYFIKGRAGTGKSTFMKKVLQASLDKGLDIELYYCSFDPSSIDMVLVRELSFCIFDSTNPHEFFPEKPGHRVIDMYVKTVTPGTDEKYANKIADVTTDYKSYMKKGIKELEQADTALEKLEGRYQLDEQKRKKALKYTLEQLK